MEETRNVRIWREIHGKLKKFAKEMGGSIVFHASKAVEEYLNKKKRKA